jgi:hypothetical protein
MKSLLKGVVMTLAAALLVGLLPRLQDGPSGVEWMDDLGAACVKARREKKLVLYRQALCDCAEKTCPYAELLRRPGFLDDAAAREAVARECVAVAARVTPGKDMEGLRDPGYGKLLTRGAPLRTFFLTPGRYILHRLDLCPYSSDLQGEIDYACMVRLTCFDSDDAPSSTVSAPVKQLEDHWARPKSYHKQRGGSPASECRCPSPRQGLSGSWNPWPGYNRGIPWHTDLDEAKVLAKHSKRLLLFFQVVGDLHKEGC